MQVDVSTRHGEGVEGRIRNHAEVVDEGLGLDPADDGLPQIVDESEHDRIVDQVDVLAYLSVEFHTDLPLLLDGDLGVRVDGIEAGAVVLDAGKHAQRDCER